MKKKLTVKAKRVGKKLGRPRINKLPGDKILSNGLFQRQQDRIKAECGTKSPTEMLRYILDWYFTQLDAEKASEEANTKLADAENEEITNPT